MRVRDVMQREVEVASPEMTAAVAGKRMAAARCGVLPVLGHGERLVGIVSDRDICLALVSRDQRASEVPLQELMTTEVRTCDADQDLRDTLETMRREQLRRLPVVDEEGRLLGIVSFEDITREAKALESKGVTGPLFSDIAITMKAICQRTAR